MSNIKFPISNFKFLVIGYLAVIFSLFLYSFTQVDLGLTLTEVSIFQEAQVALQHIGYFNRPLSAYLYVFILCLLFLFYFIFLHMAKSGKLLTKNFWKLFLTVCIILGFSYNAFSYDLFNYIFDARIITNYHQNPYDHKALDYPGDPMLGFMHWTHRTYPYGPVWLLLTVPLTFIGGNMFLLTFFLFKGLMAVAYAGTVYYIGKILEKIDSKRAIVGMVFFGLNPLVLIEGLVSGHNDIVMIFFLMVSLYYFVHRELRFVLCLILSAATKIATLILIPFFIVMHWYDKKRKINFDMVFLISLIFMIISIIAASNRTNYQPWYLLFIFPFAALLTHKYFVFIPAVVLSFVSLLHYLPFLYLGNWDPPVPMILSSMTTIGISVSLILVAVKKIKMLQ